ncbi:MAG: hypothetical protein LBQ86_02770 [Holophagales bacterium]|jgi:hypothetical protein|nr:hypothetical protein [Holophagales bacterium]
MSVTNGFHRNSRSELLEHEIDLDDLDYSWPEQKKEQERMKVAILAKSTKVRHDKVTYGYCVAGVNELGEWIRLVADHEGDSLIQADVDKTNLNVGKIFEVNVIRAPLKHQSENVVLVDFDFRLTNEDPNQYVGKLKQLNEVGIFGNLSYFLTNNDILNPNGTLRIIEVFNLVIYWDKNDKRKARFDYNGVKYEQMSMTDPKYYTRKGSLEETSIGSAYIVVSFPEKPWTDGKYYKFVAAIYPKKGNYIF